MHLVRDWCASASDDNTAADDPRAETSDEGLLETIGDALMRCGHEPVRLQLEMEVERYG